MTNFRGIVIGALGLALSSCSNLPCDDPQTLNKVISLIGAQDADHSVAFDVVSERYDDHGPVRYCSATWSINFNDYVTSLSKQQSLEAQAAALRLTFAAMSGEIPLRRSADGDRKKDIIEIRRSFSVKLTSDGKHYVQLGSQCSFGGVKTECSKN